jgi:hypothetical protein
MAQAAVKLPLNIRHWHLPRRDDLVVDPYWDHVGEDKLLPERQRARSLQDEKSGEDGTGWVPEISAPYWVVPSNGLPMDVPIDHSNNNVALGQFDGRLFLGWRTAPLHFASTKTRMILVSSADGGRTWELEHIVEMGSDVREPCFLSFKGRLIFSFFQAGTDPFKFEPKHVWRIERLAQGQWTDPETWMEDGEVPWEIKARGDKAWATSYIGNHYSAGRSDIAVHFRVSDDGLHWRHVNESHPIVYEGGVSEAGWEFDSQGDLWAVLRNEDGDETGFGSHLVHAPASDPSAWQVIEPNDPYRYDSSRMFKHGDDLYLVGRRNLDGPYDKNWSWLPFDLRKWYYLARYSLTGKRTALYQIDRAHGKVVWLRDLPSAGDTSFPSVLQTGPHTWLVANYTSPLRYPRRSWIWGQLSSQGTQIYFTEVSFKPKR